MTDKIAFQGEQGAYSHEACLKARPNCAPMPCATFEDAITATRLGKAKYAMLPIENSTYGRVADMHRLLPQSGLYINGEIFLRVRVNLLALKGAKLEDIKTASGHLVIIPQCRSFLDRHHITAQSATDNAAAAANLARGSDKTAAALSSKLAAKIYGLDVIAENIEDHQHNTTRFLLMSNQPSQTQAGEKVITSFVFQVRNIPAALYKAMGGFATNGVNMTKLESYMIGGAFTATQFYADVEGHPDDQNLKNAFEELSFFTDSVKILGTYAAAKARL